MATITPSEDGREAVLATGEAEGCAEVLDGAALSQLIARLAEVRAGMTPAFSGSFTPGQTPSHQCDNLMWECRPDASRRGLTLAFQHPGLGWISLRLSRAQAEDLITSVEFALLELLQIPGLQGLRSERPAPLPAAAAPGPTLRGPVLPVPLRRVGS